MKKLWTGIKSTVKIKQTSIVQILQLYQNGEFIKDQKSIANVFYNFFGNIGKNIDNDIPYCGTSPKHFLKNHVSNSVYLEPVTDNEITSIIESLNLENLQVHIVYLLSYLRLSKCPFQGCLP